MKMKYTIEKAMALLLSLLFVACGEESLLVNSNDVAYVQFALNMTTDTTSVSFKMYNEGEDAKIPIEVTVFGQLQQDDLSFSVGVDEKKTTLSSALYSLPTDCKIRKGLLKDTIYVVLKNDPILKTETKRLELTIVESESVKLGNFVNSKAIVTVTDRLFKPRWWSVNDLGDPKNPANSVESFYLGRYSEKKYQLFLELLKKDNVVFDGSSQMMYKYALKLKGKLIEMNGTSDESQWTVTDELGEVMRVPVAG